MYLYIGYIVAQYYIRNVYFTFRLVVRKFGWCVNINVNVFFFILFASVVELSCNRRFCLSADYIKKLIQVAKCVFKLLEIFIPTPGRTYPFKVTQLGIK